MQAKEHYENHLASFYSWMLGDLSSKSKAFEDFLITHELSPKGTKIAIDLGAGNGLQSISLKNLDYTVTAIDFNQQLLDELTNNPKAKGIQVELADIRSIGKFGHLKPELIICCGDTLTHLDSQQDIEKLIKDACTILETEGNLVLAFRDYSIELNDHQRFIPVKNSPDRILTCILEYGPEKVKVSDLLHELVDGSWIQKVSSYEKVRLKPADVTAMLSQNGMQVVFNEPINRMHTIIARKQR